MSGRIALLLTLAVSVWPAPAQDGFTRQVLGKDIAEVKAYWQQQIFSGRSVPPVIKGTDEQAVAAVGETPNAIAYGSAAADTGGAKVVQIVD